MTINRLKILWLSHFLPYPPKGGSLQRSYNLLKEVCKYHDVVLLSFVQTKIVETMFDSVEEGRVEAINHLSEFCQEVRLIDISSEKLMFGKYLLAFKSIFSRLPYAINWMISESYERELSEVMEANNFDLVHFDTISLAPYLSLVGDVPKILNHHNVESHMMLRRVESEKNILKKLYYWLEGIKLRSYEIKQCYRFKKNISCSELDNDRLRDLDHRLDLTEISNGVDVEFFRPGNEAVVPRSLIFVGGLNWYPNRAAILFFAEHVWPLLKQSCQDIVVDIVGQDPPQLLLDIACKDPSFRVQGFVDDVLPYLDRAAVYVCPISDGGGTKLKILDALAMEKAIVANPVACEGIHVVEGQSVMYARSATEFVDKILNLFDDVALRQELGRNGRQLVCDNYSYAQIGKKLAYLYNSAIH